MQKRGSQILYSATDITNFLVCEYVSTLDRQNLETPLPRAEDEEEALLLQSKGIAHEKAYLEHLKRHCTSLADLSSGCKGTS
jgi:hypothetical protein